MNNGIKVTIAIICYNYEEYVIESIKSAQSQTYKNIEIIVINDGSTDNSENQIKNYIRNTSIKYYSQNNSGVIATRNLAMDLATGDFLIQLDADDYLDKDYVEKTVSLARKNHADVVYTDFVRFGNVNDKSNFQDFNFEELKNVNYIHISSLVGKKYYKKLKFDTKLDHKSHEDWDFFLNIAANNGKFVKCKSTFLNYRIHGRGRNNMQQDFKDDRNFIDVYDYIIRKYSENGYNADFGYLFILRFSNVFSRIDEDRIHMRKQYDHLLKEHQETHNELKKSHDRNIELYNELDRIKNSKALRVKNLALKVPHKIKNAIKQKNDY